MQELSFRKGLVMRKSFVFYDGFYEVLKKLETKDRADLVDAICSYALEEKEKKLTGVLDIVWSSIKPQLDANIKRYENGKLGGKYGVLGGRPKELEDEEKPLNNPKITPNKPHPNPKITPNVNVNANVNDNANVNVNENINDNVNDNVNENNNVNNIKKKVLKKKYGIFKNVLLSDDEFEKLQSNFEDYETRIDNLSEYVESTGKVYKSHYATILHWNRRSTLNKIIGGKKYDFKEL